MNTIGIDFKTKKLNINNQEIKLKIQDTTSQERFRNITTKYYKVYDGLNINNRNLNKGTNY